MVQMKGFRHNVSLDDGSGLFISRPDLQEGMVSFVEAGEQPVDFTNEYHAAFQVRCCFCAKRTYHYHGWTARMEDGRLAFCGKDCANRMDAPLVKKLDGQLQLRMRVVAMRRSAADDIAAGAAVLPMLTDDLIELERVASALATELSIRLAQTSVLRAPTVPGIRMLSKPRMLYLRNAKERLKTWQWLNADEMSEEDMLDLTRQRLKARQEIEAGFAFLSSAEGLFSRDGIRQLATACRSHRDLTCVPSWIREPSGVVYVRVNFGEPGYPKIFPVGTFDQVPDVQRVLGALDGNVLDIDGANQLA